MENIILIGMPGCGKSTIGRLVAEKLGRTFVDTDAEIEKKAQKSIPRIFAEDGEAAFRSLETEVLTQFGRQSGLVIATGGGCVTKADNYPLLHQNGTIFWLQRDLKKLPTEGRPLSTDLVRMYEARKPLYASFADHTVDNNTTLQETTAQILAYWEEKT
jgi:shikimate dehydrogenase